jgi:putative membrane protein
LVRTLPSFFPDGIGIEFLEENLLSEKQLVMKKLSNYCLAGAMAFLCFSCNNSNSSDSTQAAKDSNATKMDSAAGGDSTGKAAIPATVSKADQDFAVNAANAGMTEIQAGQLAQQQGTAKDVKAYGAMMVTDHTQAADKLKAIAAQKNITLPAAISNDMQKNLDDLKAKNGNDFDKAYIDMMVSDHKKVISAFEDESKNGSDADIRAFADSTLHTLHHHLDAAEKCKKMEKSM